MFLQRYSCHVLNSITNNNFVFRNVYIIINIMYEFLIQCYLSESCIKTYTLLDAYDGFTGIALKMEAFEKLSCAVYTYIYKHTKKYY